MKRLLFGASLALPLPLGWSLVAAVVPEGSDLAAQSAAIPLVPGKVARKGKPTAYVCQRGVCKLPTTEATVFAGQLVDEATPDDD